MDEKPESELYFEASESIPESDTIAEINLEGIENPEDLLLIADMLRAVANESERKDCGKLLKVWYTRPCIGKPIGFKYLCQHQKWEKCGTTKRCQATGERC